MRDWSTGRLLFDKLPAHSTREKLRKLTRASILHAVGKWGIVLLIATCFSLQLTAQPAGYYDTTEGKAGSELQQVLHDIIDEHTVLSYSALWDAFRTTDDRPDGTVWDMYSDVPGGDEPYVYTFGTDQCGNYSGEGSCYNREHSFPKSWFDDASPMYTDLFHLYPTDGYVNGKRGNYPFGETDQPTWTSLNGSEVGPCSVNGYNGTVFEPIDAYKGDFARTYFYMAARYFSEDDGWPGSPMVDGAQLKPWAREMLVRWHEEDPVSDKERDRNDAVYGYQGNRNPFIDHPEFVELMYGGEGFDELAPVLDSVTVPSAGALSLWFNEPLDSLSAVHLSNYSITGGVSVEAAAYQGPDERDVMLTVGGLENGSYGLTINGVSDTAGNVMQFAVYSFEVTTLGRSTVSHFHEARVYPNPGNGLFTIETGSGAMPETFSITDLYGNRVAAGEELEGNRLDVRRLAPGVYLVTFEFEGKYVQTSAVIIR